jgi:hypothetical protein
MTKLDLKGDLRRLLLLSACTLSLRKAVMNPAANTMKSTYPTRVEQTRQS